FVIMPSLAGVGLRYAFGGEGNEGWLAVAGLLVLLGLVSMLAAMRTTTGGAKPPMARTVTETFAEPASPEGLVVATEVSVTEYQDEGHRSSVFEAAAGAVLPALARVAVAAALVAVPVLVG